RPRCRPCWCGWLPSALRCSRPPSCHGPTCGVGAEVVGVRVLCNHRHMSRRSERKAAHKAAKNAQKQAEKDLRTARDSARKAFDLKDPRFLGEAAVAATRGPAGLALFGASRGLQVARDKRAERAELLDSLTTDAKQHAATVREHASELVEPSAPPAKRRGVLRRFAPLWIIGLTGGAALAGATAYFLRDPQSGSSSSPARPSTSTPSPSPTRGVGALRRRGRHDGHRARRRQRGPGAGRRFRPAARGLRREMTPGGVPAPLPGW